MVVAPQVLAKRDGASGGALAFLQILQEWRTQGDLQGLDVS
jgi:hypothetical protein